MKQNTRRFFPSLCVAHKCNLSCVYCYQKHKSDKKMSLDTGKNVIDWIFNNVTTETDIEISFIGGEPLLEFELIKDIYNYTITKYVKNNYIFYATTNGAIITDEMKKWFTENKERFTLGLSLDGDKETHNFNRSNSFDDIDIMFFKKNWPEQGIKMTLSEYSLANFAHDIKYLHSLDYGDIRGVNLSEGDFDWDNEKYIEILIPQLKELVDFYLKNPGLKVNQMFDKRLDFCEMQNDWNQKWCGMGEGTVLFDVDGKKYPCAFFTPMTFSCVELEKILETDFKNNNIFLDENCKNNCYIYPICPSCYGSNYIVNKNFNIRNKSKCKIQKLTSLFIADLQAKKISSNNGMIKDENILYHTIEAIKKIRELYLDEFKKYL